jgi:hypothetical protein
MFFSFDFLGNLNSYHLKHLQSGLVVANVTVGLCPNIGPACCLCSLLSSMSGLDPD